MVGKSLRRSDAFLQGIVIALALTLVLLNLLSGIHVEVVVGLIYGAAMAISVHGSIVLPGSGSRVSVGSGLVVAVLAVHGFWTTLLAISTSLILLPLLRERTDLRTMMPQGVASLTGAALFRWLALAASTGMAAEVRWVLALVVSAVGVWLAARGLDAVALARSRSEGFWRLYAMALAESSWALAFYLAAAGMVLLADPRLEEVVVATLALLQRWLGSILTRVFQDRAVDELLQRVGASRQAHPGRQERVLHYAYEIGTALHLPDEQLRMLSYAAVLQDVAGDPPEPQFDLSPDPPDQATRVELNRRALLTADLLARVGALFPVAQALRYRYAWWDGRGVPPVRGEAIPRVARILAAANGLVWLLSQPPESGDPLAASRQRPPEPGEQMEQALVWLRQQEGSRLDPEVAQAARMLIRADDASRRGGTEGVLQTLRRLRALGEGTGPGPLPLALWRWLRPLQGRLAWLDRLPPEVLSVAELGRLLGATTDPAAVADQVTEAVAALSGGWVFLALRDPSGSALSIRSARGFRRLNLLGRKMSLAGGPVTRAILAQQPLVVHDLLADPPGPLSRAIALAEGLTAAAYFPLVSRGRTVGLLFVGHQNGAFLTPRRVSLLALVAGQAALAVDNGLLLAETRERMRRIDEMRRFLGALIDQLPAGVLMVEPDGRVGLINQPARQMLLAGGYPDLAVGDIFPKKWPSGPLWQALAGQSVTGELWEPIPGTFWELRASPLRDEYGRIQGALVIGWDVTRVREMEQEVQRVARLADLGKLAAGAAHEIRNPLTAIRGFAQLLYQDAEPGGDRAEYGEIIMREIDRIEAIVSDMLLLARSGDSARTRISLPQLLDDVLTLLGPELEQAGVRVVRVYTHEGAEVWGSRDRLRQVVINLVRNGIEAMAGLPGGQLTLSVGVEEQNTWFAVQDTGVGIPPEDMKSLFTPFFTTKDHGTGLGLAICYAVVESHDGRIEVQSEPGAGSTFRVWLPVAGPAALSAPAPAPKGSGP